MITPAQTERREAEPSVVSALRRVLDAGQRIVVDRIDLARLDVLAALARGVHGAVFVVLGVIPISIGWLALVVGAVVVLEGYFTQPVSLAIAGAINMLVGIGLVLVGTQRMRRPEPVPAAPPGPPDAPE